MDPSVEIWRDCYFDPKYKISNHVNIRKINNRGEILPIAGTIRNRKDRETKYKTLDIQRDNKRENYLVHRLVCIAFKENKNNYFYIKHIDGNTLNNYVNNLEWTKRNSNYTGKGSNYRTDIKEQGIARKRILNAESERRHGWKRALNYTCVCGSILKRYNRYAHNKRKKHLEYMKNKI